MAQDDFNGPTASFFVLEVVRPCVSRAKTGRADPDPAGVDVTIRGTLLSNGSAASPVQVAAQMESSAGIRWGIVVDTSARVAALIRTDLRGASQAEARALHGLVSHGPRLGRAEPGLARIRELANEF